MNRTTKINILAYASEPDKNFKYEGDMLTTKEKDILLVWLKNV